MTSTVWVVLAFLGLVALAPVVYAILILLAGRTTLDLTDFDQFGWSVRDHTDPRYWKLGFYLN